MRFLRERTLSLRLTTTGALRLPLLWTMTPDNITELALLQGSVFPVPATDVLNVQLGAALTSDATV